jgi:uncharacterized protein YkwD
MKIRALVTSMLLATALLGTNVLPAAATANSTYRWRLYLAINEVRANHGLHALRLAPGLRTIAQNHSDGMVKHDYFAHTSPTGSTLYHRVLTSNFQTYGEWWAGENLAWGTGTIGTPRYIVKMWLDSPEHRAIMLAPRYTWIGIGRRVGNFLGHSNAVVWTADFGHR